MIKVMIIPTGGLHREGITTTQLELTKRLNKSLFDITIAAVHNDASDIIEEFKTNKCSVIRFPDRKTHLLEYCRELKKELKNGYDIVHVHGSSALMFIELKIAKQCGVKVRIAHSRNTKCDYPQLDKMLRPLLYKSYNFAMACGKDAGDWLFPNREYMIFHNGKDFSKFFFSRQERQKIRAELNLENNIVYGHVGHFSPQKNHEFLLAIFKKIKDRQSNAVLYLMGDGSLRNQTEEKVRTMGLSNSVVFTGRISDIHKKLQAMDVMLFPSRFEGLPNVVIEWQAEGLPCLISSSITKECAVSEDVHFKSIHDDAEEWAEIATKLSIDDNTRERVSGNAIKKLTDEGFQINESVRILENKYLELVNGA